MPSIKKPTPQPVVDMAAVLKTNGFPVAFCGVEPDEQLRDRQVISELDHYAQSFNANTDVRKFGLSLYGPSPSGKSFYLCYVCRRLAMPSFQYTSMETVEDVYFASGTSFDRAYLPPSVLVVDDLGFPKSKVTIRVLLRLLRLRFDNGLPTFFGISIDDASFQQNYGVELSQLLARATVAVVCPSIANKVESEFSDQKRLLRPTRDVD